METAKSKPQAVDELIEVLDSQVFSALSDPTRVEILRFLLLHGRADVGTVAANLPQDRSVISRHLNLMAKAGLLVAEKESRHRFYRLNGEAFLRRFEILTATIRACMRECCP